MVKLVVCPYCGSRVGVSKDGLCPSCRKPTGDSETLADTDENATTEVTGFDRNGSEGSAVRSGVGLSASLVHSGRRLTITCFSLLILAGVAAEIGAWFATGVPDPIMGPVWILLNSIFFYYTWRGQRWSLYAAGVVNGLPAFTMLFMFVVTLLGKSQQVHLDGAAITEILMVLLTIAWIGIPSGILLISSRIRAFVASRSPNEPE